MSSNVQTKSGRYTRCYFNGTAVGLARVKSFKPEISTGLDTVEEMGNPNVVEYVPKVAVGSLAIDYMVISYGQFAIANGATWQNASTTASNTAVNGYVGEVPALPTQMDIVERLILPGTEKTANEQYIGYALHQKVQVEKESWDQEVDKLIGVNLSAKSIPPRRYEGINGIQFDNFSTTGSQTTFVLTHLAKLGKDGYATVRADVGGGATTQSNLFAQSWYEGFNYTAASTTSTTTLTFTTAPPSGLMTVIYAW